MVITNKELQVSIYPVSEGSVTLASTCSVSLPVQKKIWWLAAKLREQEKYIDIVPGMNNLTVIFDPIAHDIEKIMSELLILWKNTDYIDNAHSLQREITISVNYGGHFGPDIEEVASLCKMSVTQLIECHSQGTYTVFFIGFQPGFAYLGGLEACIATPRRAEPRLEVPAGSIGIGGSQTGIYPKVSPGGWQLIGRTDAILFDPYREQPSLLLPGDTLRFAVNQVSSC